MLNSVLYIKVLNKNKPVDLPEVSTMPKLRSPFPASHQGDGSSCASPALPLTHSPPGKVLLSYLRDGVSRPFLSFILRVNQLGIGNCNF